MLKPLLWNTLSNDQKKALLQRPNTLLPQEFTNEVRSLIKKVQLLGDEALFSLTQLFDKVELSTLRVTQEEFDAAMNQIQPQAIQAFERVIAQLTAFHQEQKISNYSVETSPGIVCERVVVPIQRVGLYVPAGSAPLVSTVLMLSVPSLMACLLITSSSTLQRS